ncbi:30S ribosomal protein S9 [Candidatus Parcubacteria bacterium]|nr:30S ribosomal protein S9 [Candidatus Parcubacteria bacterium]
MAELAYTTAVGRRKTATARVKLTPASKMSVVVNGKPGDEYFKTAERQMKTREAFHIEGVGENYEVVAQVEGGGITAQAEAIRMAVARALEKRDAALRKPLKAAGFLKRDPRSVERKKPGLLKARKRPSWSKR